MVTKAYLARYESSNERDQARRRFHAKYCESHTAQLWAIGVSMYEIDGVKAIVNNNLEKDLSIMLTAPEEKVDGLVESLKSSKIFSTGLWMESK
jgi:hypothetical protein